MKMRIALATIITTAATLSAGEAYAGTRAGQSYASPSASKGWQSGQGAKGLLNGLQNSRKGGYGNSHGGHGWNKPGKGHGWGWGKPGKGHGWGHGGGHGWPHDPDKSHGC